MRRRSGDRGRSSGPRSPKEFDRPVAQVLTSLDSAGASDYDIVLVAVPGHAVSSALKRSSGWSDNTAFLSSVKGMDPETGWFPSDVIYQATRSDYIAVMSGASVADEMRAGRPVFLTLACANLTLGRELVARIENEVAALERKRKSDPGSFNPTMRTPSHPGRRARMVASDTEKFVEKLGGRLGALSARLKRLEVH